MKVALVTGAAQGIGRAIALDLAEQGYTIIVHYHSSVDAAQEVVSSVKEYSERSMAIPIDLASAPDIIKLFQTIEQLYGRLDVLVNTVGNFGYTPLADTSIEEFDDIMNTNVRATFLMMKHALPLLKKVEKGRIINFGCVSGDQVLARKYATPYYIAKNGVITLTKSWASVLAEHGIAVNAISPGIVERSVVDMNVPMDRPAEYADFTAAVRYLVSAEADYVSGANLEIGGAWVPYR